MLGTVRATDRNQRRDKSHHVQPERPVALDATNSSGILQTLIIHVVVSASDRRLPPVGGCPAELIGVPSSKKRLTTGIGFVQTYRPQFAETPSNRAAKSKRDSLSGVSLVVNLFTAIRQVSQQLHVGLCCSRSALRHTKAPHQRLPRRRAMQAVK